MTSRCQKILLEFYIFMRIKFRNVLVPRHSFLDIIHVLITLTSLKIPVEVLTIFFVDIIRCEMCDGSLFFIQNSCISFMIFCTVNIDIQIKFVVTIIERKRDQHLKFCNICNKWEWPYSPQLQSY